MRVAVAMIAVASVGCSSLLGIDDLRLVDDATPALDGGGDATGANCIGGGLLQVCPDPPPTGQLVIVGPQVIDTGTDPACVTMQSGTTDVCVIVHGSIEIAAAATLRVVGPRPLVLAAASTISVLGTIDASSVLGKPPGGGANPNVCAAIGLPSISAAGGAGGAFGGSGGNGGNGGTIAPPRATTLEIRGGCAGGIGNSSALPAGAGGGALYLMAGGSITIDGRINASGAAGSGTLSNNTLAGGAGAGAGGLIGLDAPDITGAGTLFANGGGGGGGGVPLVPGKPGTESPDAKTAGLGGNGNGSGGNGSLGNRPDGTIGGDGQSGGGGGGGAGVIYVRGTFAVTGTLSPAPRMALP